MKLLKIITLVCAVALFLSNNAYCEDLCVDMDSQNACVLECPLCCNSILPNVQMLLSSANESLIDALVYYSLYQQPYINIPHRPPIFRI